MSLMPERVGIQLHDGGAAPSPSPPLSFRLQDEGKHHATDRNGYSAARRHGSRADALQVCFQGRDQLSADAMSAQVTDRSIVPDRAGATADPGPTRGTKSAGAAGPRRVRVPLASCRHRPTNISTRLAQSVVNPHGDWRQAERRMRFREEKPRIHAARGWPESKYRSIEKAGWPRFGGLSSLTGGPELRSWFAARE